MPKWLDDAVLYEIYPQSFYDTNGDGIGDIPGITQKLGYIKELGCNALWINPCFDSSFKDAGYDVRDYKKIAPRGEADLQSKANLEILYAEKGKVPFVYKRGSFVMAVNPSGQAAAATGKAVFTQELNRIYLRIDLGRIFCGSKFAMVPVVKKIPESYSFSGGY
ncbi:hypothetical protein FACS1894172_02670 [Spirochaetia bacterium]|nr:hypothetical protein FACS1894164_18340 [Spirochaetia bacterium]GHU30119.1 hypothetical protein FACS1894172_02670 [Spirochaetia bacterium]